MTLIVLCCFYSAVLIRTNLVVVLCALCFVPAVEPGVFWWWRQQLSSGQTDPSTATETAAGGLWYETNLSSVILEKLLGYVQTLWNRLSLVKIWLTVSWAIDCNMTMTISVHCLRMRAVWLLVFISFFLIKTSDLLVVFMALVYQYSYKLSIF